MLSKVLNALLSPAAPRDTPAPELALAALLVRPGRAGGRYGHAEQRRIEQVLGRILSLPPAEATRLRHQGEIAEAEAADSVRFTRAIKDAWPPEDRPALIGAMWEVALADGSRDSDEDAEIRLAASLLGVTDRDSALARQRAVARPDMARPQPWR